VTHLAGAWRDECEGNKSNPPVKGDFHRRIYFGRKDQSQVSTCAKPIVSRLRLWPHSSASRMMTSTAPAQKIIWHFGLPGKQVAGECIFLKLICSN